MEEVIELSKKFVEKDQKFILIDTGYGINVIRKELIGSNFNEKKCDTCEKQNCFNVWDTIKKSWVDRCPYCIRAI